MRTLIVEDEKLAANRLSMLVKELRPSWDVGQRTDSIEDTVAVLGEEQFDLIFLDVQLSDGISFEIFNRCEVKVPVIFTTAYDEYAVKAFKVNSVDYLLKPLDKNELSDALDKFDGSTQSTPDPQPALDRDLMQS